MAPKKKPTDELKDQRVPIMMSADELKAIDDWSFKHRIRSRGEAIRRLCLIGTMISAEKDLLLQESLGAMDAMLEGLKSVKKRPPEFTKAIDVFSDWSARVADLGLNVDVWESGETLDDARDEMADLTRYREALAKIRKEEWP